MITRVFGLLRFKTTLKWHQRATRLRWYRKWHSLRFAEAMHLATIFIFMFFAVFTVFSALNQGSAVKGKIIENSGASVNSEVSWERFKSSRAHIKDIEQLPSGQYQAKVYSDPVQYLDENGEWVDIDTKIETASTKGAAQKNKELSVSKAPYKASFSISAAQDLTVENDAGTVKMSYLGAADTTGIVSGNVITYENVYKNVDIKRTFSGGNIKQDIILTGPGYPTVFREKITTAFDVVLQTDNSINYYKDGQLIGYTPPINLVDARGRTVPLQVSYQDGILEIKVETDKKLAYPAVIDPTFVPNPTLASGNGYSGSPELGFGVAASYLNAGNYVYDAKSGLNTNERSVIRFDTSALGSASTVTAASLYMYFVTNIKGISATSVYNYAGTWPPAYPTPAGSVVGTLSPVSASTWYNTAISDLTTINKTGYSSFVLTGVETDAVNYDSSWASQNTTVKPYLVVTLTRPVPDAPTNPGGTGLSPTSIRWTWADATLYEDGYKVHDASNTVMCTIATPNSTSCDESGLTVNTSYTRHIHAYNAESGDSAASADVTKYTLTNIPTSSGATAVSDSQIDVSWSAPVSGGVDHYHVKSSSDGYATVKYNSTGTTWSETGLSPNTQYTYRIYGVNADNAESATYATVTLFTLTNKPVINAVTLYTNDTTPTVSNSSTPYTSFANKTVKLKDNGTVVAQTTANASGVFTFYDADYPTPLTDGLHNNLTVVVLNSDNQESVSSDAFSIHVDTDPPQGPTAATAKEGSSGGADLVSNAWNLHNNGPTVYFAWTGADDTPFPPNSSIKRHWVYFGPNASALPRTDGQATADAVPSVTKTLTSPVSGTDYYLRIQSEDEAGNISADVDVTTLFTYKFDNTPPDSVPSISVNPSSWATADPYVFTWSDGTDANSGLYGYDYKRNNGTDGWTRVINTNPDTASVNHYQSGINYFLINTVDNAGNVSSTVSWPYLYSGTVNAPQNLAVDISQSQGQTVNNFKFTWDAPGGANIVGYYYSVNAAPNTENSTYTTNTYTAYGPFAKASGVSQTFYVAAKDEFGNVGWSSPAQVSFVVNTVAPDAPTNVTITDSSSRESTRWQLTIGWDEPATLTPDFDGYVVQRSTDGLVFDDLDTVTKRLDGTIPNGYLDTKLSNTTTYYYRVRSRDNTGNTSTASAVVSRMPTGKYTTPPTITSTPVATPKATAVTVTWTTNRVSNSIVQYGPTTAYGQEVSKSTEAVTSHSIDILGLTPGMTYHFRVQSLDADRDYDPCLALSSDYNFTTSQAPGISNVNTSEVRLTSAIVTWQTTSAATSKILYGETTAYGKTYTDNSGSQTTTHTVKLTDLKDSTVYHYRIQGIDIEGNVLTSDDYIFETLTFPKLSNLALKQVPTAATSTVEVTFSSNVPITSSVTFAGTNQRNADSYTLSTEHKVTVSGLSDNTQYTVTVRGRDQYGNEALALNESYKTSFDTRPPSVTNVNTETEVSGYGVDAKGQIIVSWETDEPATSQIEYGIGSSGSYTNKTQEDATLSTTTHVVIISDLKTSSAYHFRVVSKDASGNEVKSEEYTTLTPQANRSIFESILGALDKAIGWLFRR